MLRCLVMIIGKTDGATPRNVMDSGIGTLLDVGHHFVPLNHENCSTDAPVIRYWRFPLQTNATLHQAQKEPGLLHQVAPILGFCPFLFVFDILLIRAFYIRV